MQYMLAGRLVQGKDSSPLKVLLNNSVELSSKLDKPVLYKSGIKAPLLTQSFELLSS